MATKAQVVAALEKHAPGATLIIQDNEFAFQAKLEAPKGHHWECEVHCLACMEWYGKGNRSEYWQYVLNQVKELPKAVPCCDDDCEGIRNFGECEYWV